MKRCPNSDCRMLWLDPMPIEEDIGKAYESYFTHQDLTESRASLAMRLYDRAKLVYASSHFETHNVELTAMDRVLGLLLWLTPIYRASIDTKINQLPKKKRNGRLLEVGCGEGTTLQFVQQMGWNVEGLDVDRKAVEIAKKKGLPVKSGNLFEANFEPGSFDVVTMFHVIEHVHDPRGLLLECLRILRPGGQILLVTPNALSLAHRIYGRSCFHLDPPRHLRLFTPNALSRITNIAGFNDIQAHTRISGANFVFAGSRSILHTGHGRYDQRPNRALLFWARTMQTFEWILHKFCPNIGEELQVCARKSPDV